MMDERVPSESNTTDDQTLLREIASGSESALRDLYDRHTYWLASRLRRRMSAEAAEDVLQETFLAVWKGADRYQSSGDVAAWMWGVARRQAALWFRNRGNEQRAAEFLDEQMKANDDPARSAVTTVDVQRAFATLGPGARSVAHKAFIEERTIAEIGRSLDIPEGTQKSRFFTIHRKLSAALGKEHLP